MTSAAVVPQDNGLFRLIGAVLDERRAEAVLSILAIDTRLCPAGEMAGRAQVATALNAILFSRLLDRVPTAAAYVAEVRAEGRRVWFDHGALRTVDGATGALPSGYLAFSRLLEPLGYRLGGTYPLPALNMTGRAFVHRDWPESVPQFFVSELHVDRLAEDAGAAAEAVFGQSRDPLGPEEWRMLDSLQAKGECSFDLALAGLPGLAAAFDRQHDIPRLADYEVLLRNSSEAAWTATEGNMFNHATDRVTDVVSLVAELRVRGLPLKAEVEVSANGRVRQTAFLADRVTRQFRLADGSQIEREVPGSFYEFISRDIDPETGKLDLSFDSGNATGIFAVTSAT